MNDFQEAITGAPSLELERERLVPIIKEFRKEVDALIRRVSPIPQGQEALGNEIKTRHHLVQYPIEQTRTKLVEAKMWAGKILEYLGNPFPEELADNAK